MKKVLFFSYGDSRKASTWSNVPYLFSATLEEKGYHVIRVSLTPNKVLKAFYSFFICRVLRILFPLTVHSYLRSRLNHFLLQHRIDKIVSHNQDAELCIFTMLDYCPKHCDCPVILLSDWTYEFLIRERLERQPYFFENHFFSQQSDAISRADYVISLFPTAAQKMRQNLPHANIRYLNRNVVNLFCDPFLDEEEILSLKCESKQILFIGNHNYESGAKLLIKAFSELKPLIDGLSLHIIGMDSINGVSSEDVVFHGYLRKDNPEECAEYYRLLRSSRVVVNPTINWAGYSSITEAMYFYTPVVVTPFADLIAEFGPVSTYGAPVTDNNPHSLASLLYQILNNTGYRDLCKSAHEKVKDNSWSKYVDEILNLCV